jgi:hypothetical protein
MRNWLKDSTSVTMSDTQAAWLAGFFDGEGGIYSYQAGRNKQYKSWNLAIYNTNLASLKACVRITGCGTINRKPDRPRCKPTWRWQIASQRNLVSVLTQILPYLVIKRAKVKAYLKTWKDVRNVA